jgi:glycopeptide antibiotics resistance protein
MLIVLSGSSLVFKTLYNDYFLLSDKTGYILSFLVLLILLTTCIIHYGKSGYLNPVNNVVFYSLLFYILGAVLVIILPLPKISPDFCQTVAIAAKQPRLIPFQFVEDIINADGLKNFAFLQVFLNFLLLMPAVIYLYYYKKASSQIVAIGAIATSLVFEITQVTGIYGLYPCAYRTFDIDDLILNSSGAITCYAIIKLVTKFNFYN